MFKKIIFTVFILGMITCASAFASGEKLPITIYLAGDSTVYNYPERMAPMAGWGTYIGASFSDKVTVVNRSIGGRSSKSYIKEGRLANLLKEIKPGDYLLIQFGHNDADKKPDRFADADTTYKECLKEFVQGAKEKGAIPILITPVEKRKFVDGKAVPTHGKYPDAMKQVAQEENVVVLDLTTASREHFNEMGEEATKEIFMNMKPGEFANYPQGQTDNTHFKQEGAEIVAKLIVDELKKSNSNLKNYLE